MAEARDRDRRSDQPSFFNARMLFGVGILTIVALILAFTLREKDGGDDAIIVEGYVGGKLAFLENDRVQKFLKDEYNIVVKPTRLGSWEHVTKCRPPLDFCWPSSETAGELLTQQPGVTSLGKQTIFNSPIVFYTWVPISDALIAQGIVRKQGDTYYMNDTSAFIALIQSGTPWAQIGLPQLYGSATIHTSDPIESNTGNSFAGMLANNLNGGQVVSGATAPTVTPDVVAFFAKLGLLPSTTTELFEQFLTLGMGGAPIIVAYESNLIEHSLLHPGNATKQFLANNIRTIYPEPTVWSSQPMIALTEDGARLIEALRRPEIQAIGWEDHAFRTAVPGVVNDPTIFGIPGVPDQITSVMPMPAPQAMLYITEALGMPPLPITRRAGS